MNLFFCVDEEKINFKKKFDRQWFYLDVKVLVFDLRRS